MGGIEGGGHAWTGDRVRFEEEGAGCERRESHDQNGVGIAGVAESMEAGE